MSETPFYINLNGNNVITNEIKQKFVDQNPDLAEIVFKTSLELKLIEYGDFQAFCYWIIGQHISGRVANVLISRLTEYVKEFTPTKILSLSIDNLRELGLSRPKCQYLLNLASFFMDQDGFDARDYSSQELIKHFSQVKGVGEWTVQMHLIFTYGRMDIFSPKDLVVRKGLAKLYDLPTIPSEKEAQIIGLNWGEFATVGTILCWALMGE